MHDLVELMRNFGDDRADAGAATWEREHELSLTDHAKDLLAQTRHALERVETGSYGDRESCGSPIRQDAAPGLPACDPVHDMQAEAGTPLTTARPRRTALALGLGVTWLLADQLTKAWAERALTEGEPVPVIGDLLRLHLSYNPGAAFSMGTGLTPVLTAVATLISAVIIWQILKVRSVPWAIALGLLLGGATGNLVDRYFRAPGPGSGRVVDFLRLPNFPIFNVADIGVTSAAVLIGILALRGFRTDGTREGDEFGSAEQVREGGDGRSRSVPQPGHAP